MQLSFSFDKDQQELKGNRNYIFRLSCDFKFVRLSSNISENSLHQYLTGKMMFLAVQLLVLGTLVDQSLACLGLNPSACGKRDVEVSS